MPAQQRAFAASCREVNDDLSREEIVRSLIEHLSLFDPNSPPAENSNGEELLVDTEVNGWRYVLIRTFPSPNPLVQLSPREQEIVRMVAVGHPNKVIAAVLNISSWTVGTHLRRIFAKLGVGSRAAMVARCMDLAKASPAHSASSQKPPALAYLPKPGREK